MPPMEGADHIVALAKKAHCRSIAYTYTEPTIFFEYAYDIAAGAKKEGLKNLFSPSSTCYVYLTKSEYG